VLVLAWQNPIAQLDGTVFLAKKSAK